ncbi:MAG TPA: tRNA pseudouridine(55) synthase TruB, partial [Anaeromyxobacteraceae bacterium]|nr:tRNA pseudouridine(55) synthase TruB [Anaeromyxobacteraceae bacterium]
MVLRARRALGTRAAGHTGTLDPAATGLLAICVGDGLKIQRWLTDGDKAYQAT